MVDAAAFRDDHLSDRAGRVGRSLAMRHEGHSNDSLAVFRAANRDAGRPPHAGRQIDLDDAVVKGDVGKINVRFDPALKMQRPPALAKCCTDL